MAARSVGRQGQGLVDVNMVATAASILIAGAGLSYTLSARPKVRVVCHRITRKEDEADEWVDHGYVVALFNTGRAPAVIQSAGSAIPGGGYACTRAALLGHEDEGPSAPFPAMLGPGQTIRVWLTPEQGDSGEIGALYLRYPWAGMRWLKRGGWAARTKRLREKRVREVSPRRPQPSA